MLEAIGLERPDQLFSAIPESIRVGALNLPEGRGELAVSRLMNAYAEENTVFKAIFRGAGAYNHYIPSIVKAVAAKESFSTAYTPYQAEISQGILQSIFEFQTMICELTGMEAANASVYDGATAAAEGVAMCREKGRNTVLAAKSANPMTVRTIETYAWAANAEFAAIPLSGGRVDLDALRALLDDRVACAYVQQPNFYGLFEDMGPIEEAVHASGAKLVMGVHPIACAVMCTPGEVKADVAVGEGQPLGLPLAFGGPHLGFMASTKAMVRRMPGRIAGETADNQGRRAYVLTLQAREQHIRREKASSNICTNQALCAMAAGAYMAAMGRDGLTEVANHCHGKADYLRKALCGIPGFEPTHEGPFFNEFVTATPVPAENLMNILEERGILGGLPLPDGDILWCATEMNTRAQMDELAQILREAHP